MNEHSPRKGPLAGVRVVEFASIGPGPHCAMLLADMGAEVLRIDRPGGNAWDNPVMDRGRAKLVLDIRSDEGRTRCIEILEKADILVEGMRPGVMERLGLGPEDVARRNTRLIYGRMTGWGQDGPLARVAGHDLNYIAVTGALAAVGVPGAPPPPPLNLIGDFGGGSLFLALGLVAALWERERSGRGQVVDAAIVDGVASMMTMFTGLIARGSGTLDRERNLLGGAAPFYRCYECADGRYVSVGAIEPQFYAQLVGMLEGGDALRDGQYDVASWPARAEVFARIFRGKTRDEWAAIFDGTDACVMPVLEIDETAAHPQIAARQTYFDREGALHCGAAPRFSRTQSAPAADERLETLLERWGFE